ncbi:hypothetical protein BGZ65_003874, partial [Modicella reniformis]
VLSEHISLAPPPRPVNSNQVTRNSDSSSDYQDRTYSHQALAGDPHSPGVLQDRNPDAEATHFMPTERYLEWATDKKPKKEHVSFPNFVKRFDIYDKDTANEKFSSLIGSSRLRDGRRNKLRKAYNNFLERYEDSFWEQRALKVASRRLKINFAIAAKETAVIIQNTSVKETISESIRYQTGLEMIEDSDDEIIDDSDSESEVGTETDKLAVEDQSSSEASPNTVRPTLPKKDSVSYPSITDKWYTSSPFIPTAGQKHPRDRSDDENAVKTKTSWNRGEYNVDASTTSYSASWFII